MGKCFFADLRSVQSFLERHQLAKLEKQLEGISKKLDSDSNANIITIIVVFLYNFYDMSPPDLLRSSSIYNFSIDIKITYFRDCNKLINSPPSPLIYVQLNFPLNSYTTSSQANTLNSCIIII